MSFGGQEERQDHLSMSPDGRILVCTVIRLPLERNGALTTCDTDDEEGDLVVL